MKMFAFILAALSFQSVAMANTYFCAVTAESGSKPGSYDQILNHYKGPLDADKSQSLLTTDLYTVTAEKKSDSALQLIIYDNAQKKMRSLTWAKSDSVLLIDGQLGWSVYCLQQ